MIINKTIKIILAMQIVGLFLLVNLKTEVNAFPSSNMDQEEQKLVMKETNKIFGNIEIDSMTYLYNLNDSPDFIYVDFKDLGYVIFYRDTLEIMEFSCANNLNYSNCASRKYYAGPSNYYEQINNRFIDVYTGCDLNMSESDIVIYANDLSTLFSMNLKERESYSLSLRGNRERGIVDSSRYKSSPPFDKNNFISANIPGSANTAYIDNYNYFLVNPNHGFNQHGTCGSVAAQLLLSYNNYYNDRRIIDVEHLFGDWTGAISNDLYDASNYLLPNQNMNVCNDPTNMTSFTTGTNDDFYEYVIQNIEPAAFTCVDTIDPDGTINHSHNGSSLSDVHYGLDSILYSRLPSMSYNITSDEEWWLFGWSPISSIPIKNEIDNNRPVIIGMSSHLNSIDHWVVGYGYQDYTYPEDGGTYSGYIVNFGWTNRHNVWINESWCNAYIALSINHNHNYNIVTSNVISGSDIELRCSDCGHRTLTSIFNVTGNAVTGLAYPVSGSIVIPSVINGVIINSIGNQAFKNCTSITSVTIPNTVTSIGSNAFDGCTNLESVTLPSSLQIIGSSAFKGCTSLEEIEIPSSVNSIGANAFKICSSLESVTIKKEQSPITTIGSNTFMNCFNISEIKVPDNRIADYVNNVVWSGYSSLIVPENNNYTTYYLGSSPINASTYLNVGYNKLYKLVVTSSNTYYINLTSNNNITTKLYDSNYQLLNSSNGLISRYLNSGSTYYLSVEYNNSSWMGTIYTNITADSSHQHSYTYVWNSYTKHTKQCTCGDSSLKSHVVDANAFNNGQQYATCMVCGGLASVGINPRSNNNYSYTLNGSFILPNGVIVLVEEDYEAYMNDTLVFINPNDNIDRGNSFIPCLIRKEDNYWINVS